jgi:vacuolar protein sorting-associated protein 35
MTTTPPPVEDQARLLEDALAVVRQQTVMMRRCLETPGKLMDALKCRYDGQQNLPVLCDNDS